MEEVRERKRIQTERGNFQKNLQQRVKETKKQREQKVFLQKRRDRGIIILKQKYLNYLFQYSRFGTTTHTKKRIKQALEEILKLVKKQGISREYFLSNKVAGTNAKPPENLY